MEHALTYDEAQALIGAPDPALDAAVTKVSALEFPQLKAKLVEEKGWSVEQCEEVEDLYRKFLALLIRYPDRKLSPTGPVDDFWHAHILDTRAYARDCDVLFGFFYHHYPYFGTRGPEDRADLEVAFEWTIERFIVHFGIDPSEGDSKARGCRPQK